MINPLTVAVAKAAGKGAIHWIATSLRVLAVVGIVWSIYVMAIKPHINPTPTESYHQIVQSGGTNYNIEVYNPEDTFFLGVKFWGLKFGLSKPTVKKISEITKETRQNSGQNKGKIDGKLVDKTKDKK